MTKMTFVELTELWHGLADDPSQIRSLTPSTKLLMLFFMHLNQHDPNGIVPLTILLEITVEQTVVQACAKVEDDGKPVAWLTTHAPDGSTSDSEPFTPAELGYDMDKVDEYLEQVSKDFNTYRETFSTVDTIGPTMGNA